MPMPIRDLTGQRFGLLTAIKRDAYGLWVCACDCGLIVHRRTGYVTGTMRGARKAPQSCGCAVASSTPIAIAMLYRGEVRSVRELSEMTGIERTALYKHVRAGVTTEAKLDELRASYRKRNRMKRVEVVK